MAAVVYAPEAQFPLPTAICTAALGCQADDLRCRHARLRVGWQSKIDLIGPGRSGIPSRIKYVGRASV